MTTEGRGSGCLLVLGTGGAGGSTVAAALSLAAATGGAQVRLVGVGPTEDVGSLLGGPRTGDEDDEPWRLGGRRRVRTMTISVERAFADLFGFTGVGGFIRRAATGATVPMITAVTPGFESLLQLGVVEELQRRHGADLLVVDCPAGDAGTTFLDAPTRVRGVVRAESVLALADRVRSMYADRARCAVVLVTSPDESAVAEGIEMAAKVRSLGVDLLALVVDRCWPDRSTPWSTIATTAQALSIDDEAAELLESTSAFARNVIERQRAAIAELEAGVGLPAVMLARRPTRQLAPSDLHVLAGCLGRRR